MPILAFCVAPESISTLESSCSPMERRPEAGRALRPVPSARAVSQPAGTPFFQVQAGSGANLRGSPGRSLDRRNAAGADAERNGIPTRPSRGGIEDMKKVLLGTSALVALGLVTPAYGQLDLNITGSVDVHFGFVDDDGEPDGSDNREYGGFVDTTLNLNGDGLSDNGLTYGFRINLDDRTPSESSATDFVIDESWIFVRGDFGEVRLGGKEGVTTTLGSFGVPSTGTGIADGDYGAYAYSAPSGNNTALIGGFTDSTRITYIGMFGDADVGVSFAPSDEERHGDPDLDNDFSAIEDRIDIAGNYTFNFEGGSFQIGGGISFADATDDTENNFFGYIISVRANFGGFSIGGFYGDNGDSLGDVGTGGSYEIYGAGATYSIDGLTVGANALGYQDSRTFSMATVDDEGFAAGFGAEYALFPGFTPYGEVVFYQEDDDVAMTSTDGVVFLMGATAAW
ncbi:MAG: porin [Azospirillaceae bacterium]